MEEDSTNICIVYVVILFIIVIAVYSISYDRKNGSCGGNSIIIETKKMSYDVPVNICDIYLMNILKYIKLLYDSADRTKCIKLNKYINASIADLQKFNQTRNIQVDDVDLVKYGFVDQYKFYKDLERNGDEKDSLDNDRLFVNLIINMELVLHMIRNSKCDDKKLVLISVHNLMEYLHRNKCRDVDNMYDSVYKDISNFSEDFADKNNTDQYYVDKYEEAWDIMGLDETGLNIRRSAIKPVKGASINTNYSQNTERDVLADEFFANEQESLLYKADSLREKYRILDQVPSQEFECSADYILTSKSSQPYTPFCDINKLREEREKLRKKTLDLNFNRSLRNDYDYLDE